MSLLYDSRSEISFVAPMKIHVRWETHTYWIGSFSVEIHGRVWMIDKVRISQMGIYQAVIAESAERN